MMMTTTMMKKKKKRGKSTKRTENRNMFITRAIAVLCLNIILIFDFPLCFSLTFFNIFPPDYHSSSVSCLLVWPFYFVIFLYIYFPFWILYRFFLLFMSTCLSRFDFGRSMAKMFIRFRLYCCLFNSCAKWLCTVNELRAAVCAWRWPMCTGCIVACTFEWKRVNWLRIQHGARVK